MCLKPENNASLNPERPLFPISVIADILGIHQRTLRIYDEQNLLSPTRSSRNRRLYSFNDLENGKFIQYLTRNLGINLAGVKIITYLLAKQVKDQSKFMASIEEIAKALNVTPEVQEENKIKLSKRGRKPSKPAE